MPIYSKDTEADELLRKTRLPKLGIIRLGFKETRNRPDGSEYTFPRAADHFVLVDAPAVAERYGDEPTIIEPVYIPLEDDEDVASHYYRMFNQSKGMVCWGDGRKASRWVDMDKLKETGEPVPASGETTSPPERKEVSCPCPFLEEGRCSESILMKFLIPEVAGVGVWWISTKSKNSIQNLQGSMTMIRAIAGGVTGIALRLKLAPETVMSPQGKKVTVKLLSLEVLDKVTPLSLASRRKTVGILTEGRPIQGEELGDPETAVVEEYASHEDMQAAETAEEDQNTLELRQTEVLALARKEKKFDNLKDLIPGMFGEGVKYASLRLDQLNDLAGILEGKPPVTTDQEGDGGTTLGDEPEVGHQDEEVPEPDPADRETVRTLAQELGFAPYNIEVPKVLGTEDEPVTLAHFLMTNTLEDALKKLNDAALIRQAQTDLGILEGEGI